MVLWRHVFGISFFEYHTHKGHTDNLAYLYKRLIDKEKQAFLTTWGLLVALSFLVVVAIVFCTCGFVRTIKDGLLVSMTLDAVQNKWEWRSRSEKGVFGEIVGASVSQLFADDVRLQVIFLFHRPISNDIPPITWSIWAIWLNLGYIFTCRNSFLWLWWLGDISAEREREIQINSER